ncbi:MAG: hypothetical protein KGQ36_01395 [Rickettsiales bacterium]|nr:hypothetical protein [Rickettsiales bacterium]
MTNPFSDLDGKRKYLFTRGDEDFYLKVVTSQEEAAKCRDAITGLNSITVDSEAQLQETISKKGERIKDPRQPTSPEKMKDAVDNFHREFGHDDNATMFILENEGGEFVNVILVTINDPQKRANLKVPDDVGTFVYVSDISTNNKYRVQNLFSTAFDKMLTMISNEKRGLEKPIEYSISVTATTAIQESGEEVEYVRNLPRYVDMWEKRFSNNKLQDRRYLTTDGKTKQVGLDRMPLDDFLDVGKKLDEEKISGLIKRNKSDRSGMPVRGLYLEGDSASYGEMKDTRKRIFEEKAKHGFERHKETKPRGWSATSLKDDGETKER